MHRLSLKEKLSRVYVLRSVKRYLADTSGSTAIEYSLIGALISLMAISGASALGGSVNEQFTDIAKLLSGELSPAEIPSANIVG